MSCLFIMKYILINLLISSSLESCHPYCQTCYEYSNDYNNMKCISCKNDLYLVFNTSNCEKKSDYPDYYLNKTNFILFPFSNLRDQNCYECDPYLETKGKCLSCDKDVIKVMYSTTKQMNVKNVKKMSFQLLKEISQIEKTI